MGLSTPTPKDDYPPARNVALRHGLSTSAAARLVGVSRQTITRWVRDSRPNRRPLLVHGEDWGMRGSRVEIYPSALPKMRTCIAFPKK
ncbi:MAG: helix-turn-helix domain-containing protein [Puniceicoccales bacterium]|nr:helix-turn-helix domain-containing protein [Puniceicoccales bacterium]